MLKVEHIAPANADKPNYDPILSVLIEKDAEIEFRFFDDASSEFIIDIGDSSAWICLNAEETLALQSALNKAFPV